MRRDGSEEQIFQPPEGTAMDVSNTHSTDNTTEARFLAPETHQRAGVGRTQHCAPEACKKEIASLLRDNARRHRLHRVFSDFCELCALAISNSTDKLQFDVREARYLQIVSAYERDEVLRFSRMLASLVEWLECGLADCLGELFMSLDLGDHFKGQFFTPYAISALMAGITVGDVRDKVARQGFITLCEPTCGAGGMVIACADAIHTQGVNYQQAMHATAVDVDATAVHMTFVQLALLHVPAIVVHGNSLSLQEWSHWVTPAHVLGGWDRRLRARSAARTIGTSQAQALPKAAQRDVGVPSSRITDIQEAVVSARLSQLGLFD
jgi:hypothetical protein